MIPCVAVWLLCVVFFVEYLGGVMECVLAENCMMDIFFKKNNRQYNKRIISCVYYTYLAIHKLQNNKKRT